MARRRTPQQEQEVLSRRQVALAWMDWVFQGSTEDLGEDFFIQIYEAGKSSGLSFALQLKSTSDLASTARHRHVSYPFETKDLKHWEQSAQPVVLLVWDINEERGVWIEIREAIADLETRRKGWRNQKTASVMIPLSNTTEDVGRRSLRLTIFHREFPVLSAGRQLKFAGKFEFPDTEEGKQLAAAYQETIDAGGAVTIPGEFIKEFIPPGWWKTAAGDSLPSGLTISSAEKSVAIPLTIVASSGGSEKQLAVVLRHTRGGQKVSLFEDTTREGIYTSFEVGYTEADPSLRFSCSVDFRAHTVRSSRIRTEFLLAAAESGRVQLFVESETPLGPALPFAAPDRGLLERWLATLQLMADVEALLPDGVIFDPSLLSSEKELQRLWELRELLRGSAVSATGNWAFDLQRPEAPKDISGGELVVNLPSANEELLGVRFSSGVVRVEFVKGHEPLVEALRSWPDEWGGARRVEMKDVEIRLTWTDWSARQICPDRSIR